MKLLLPFLICFIYSVDYCNAKTWKIGPTRSYTLPSQVKTLVQDGDSIVIDAGIYLNDATKWSKKNLHFIGLGTGTNRCVLRFNGNIPNGKGIFVFESPGISDNPLIENIVFDGAQVSNADGGNGAGIRFQARNITINNCKFVNCQNGILEGNAAVSGSNVIITNTEFENNGYKLPNDPTFSGYEHHIYIGASTDSLLVQNCWFHHPRGMANSLKTRAQKSYILYNLIDEEDGGYGSWEINIAQGGLNVIMGNIIVQGNSGANHGIIGYDAATNALEELYFINNTVINRFAGNVKYFNFVPSTGINKVKIYNNIFASLPSASNTFISGNIPAKLDTAANLFARDYRNFGFTNSLSGDFTLASVAVTAIDKGVNAGNASSGFTLIPKWMYNAFNTTLRPRLMYGNRMDIGAFEFAHTSPVVNNNDPQIHMYPNPTNGDFIVETTEDLEISIFNIAGEVMLKKTFEIGANHLSIEQPGIYYVSFHGKSTSGCKKLIVAQHH
ncbi:MAG: T9SS type A sorting domain-containing protein [Saprospiraceae bacterium]